MGANYGLTEFIIKYMSVHIDMVLFTIQKQILIRWKGIDKIDIKTYKGQK